MVDRRARDLTVEFIATDLVKDDVILIDQSASAGVTGKITLSELEIYLERIAKRKRKVALTKDINNNLIITTRYYEDYLEPVDLTVDRIFESFDTLPLDYQNKVAPTITIDGTTGIPVYSLSNETNGNSSNLPLNRNAVASGINRWIYYAPTAEFPNGRVYYTNIGFYNNHIYFMNTPADYIAGFLRLDGSTNGLSNFTATDFPDYAMFLNGNTTIDMGGHCISAEDGVDIIYGQLNNGRSESWSFSINPDVCHKEGSSGVYFANPSSNIQFGSNANYFSTSYPSYTESQMPNNKVVFNEGNFLNKPASFGLKSFLKI